MGQVVTNTLDDLIRANQIVFTKKQKRYLRVKRAADFLCSFIAIVLLSPVFLIVSILIKIDSPKEAILFKQERIGQYGHPFCLYKFRSMKKGTPELGTNEFVNAEQYITKIGKFIRKTSLDELPQLWCVLFGKMSLIGARPLILREDAVHFLRNYYGIYQLKPGITGLAQINGRDAMGNYEKVRWDRVYARNVSFALDCKILWQTMLKVLRCEGIEDGDSQKKDLTVKEPIGNGYQAYKDEMRSGANEDTLEKA